MRTRKNNLEQRCVRRVDRLARTGRKPGFTLVELLVTLVVISILAAAIVPAFRTSASSHLQSAAQIVASDFEVARNLAVTNQSKYRLVFTAGSSSYYLEHSGTNTALNVLPASPFNNSAEQATRHTTELAEIVGNGVEILGVQRGGLFAATSASIEFTPLGNTTYSSVPIVWLHCGEGDEERFYPVSINPTTGLADLGEFTAQDPRGSATQTNGS